MTQSKYFGPIKWLGSAIVILLVAGQLFGAFRDDLLPEGTRDSVLWQALPFVSVFISIILAFVLLIFMVALRLNGKIPLRTQQPIEWLSMAGIVLGVVSLFQPFWAISYEYGFLLLLFSTIFFTLWSHIIPKMNHDETLLPFKQPHHLIGATLGLVVVVIMTVAIASYTKPVAPYNLTQRRWDRTDPEEQAQIADQAEKDYRTQEIPYIIFLSAFPGALLYFATREALASMDGDQQAVHAPA